jgi:predicted transcriptional regulator
MPRGRLSQTEKYTIQGALHQGKTTIEIAELLGRTEQAVQHYIDGELDELIETVTKVALNKTESNEPQPEQPSTSRLKAGDLMGRKTIVKEEGGVAIMTEGASAIGDEFRKEMPKRKVTRTSKGNVYEIDSQKILNE